MVELLLLPPGGRMMPIYGSDKRMFVEATAVNVATGVTDCYLFPLPPLRLWSLLVLQPQRLA